MRRSASTLLAASLLSGCGPGFATGYRQELRQSALMLAPTPLFADAPLTPTGSVAVEGGVTFAPRGSNDTDRRGGASGHLIPDVSLRGRVAWRPFRHFEFALAGVGAPGSLASSYARDLSPGAFSFTEVFFAGLQWRAVFNPASPVQVGLSASLLFGRVPWSRTVDETSISGTTTRMERRVETDASFVGWLGLAGFVTGEASRHVTLLGGFSLQTQPYVRGYQELTFTCFGADCDGPSAGKTPVIDQGAAGLLFASVTVRLGPVAIVGRAHGTLFGPDAVVDPGRFGGGIDLRGTFSR